LLDLRCSWLPRRQGPAPLKCPVKLDDASRGRVSPRVFRGRPIWPPAHGTSPIHQNR
jgi:hypothetical protein